MALFVAELDERGRIAAVWVKDSLARNPTIFDPKKHFFDKNLPSEFHGAPRAEMERWLANSSKVEAQVSR